MTALRPFRFGVIAYDATSKEEWVAKARRIEQLGYSTLLVPDHLGKQLDYPTLSYWDTGSDKRRFADTS